MPPVVGKKEITFHWITILVPLVSHFSSWQFIWAENEANEKEWKSNKISNGQLHYYEVQGLAIRSFTIAAIQKMNVQIPLGAIHKRRRYLFGRFWYPPPPCQNFDPDFPNFYLLISCNIGIWDTPSPLEYSDFFYGWPPTFMNMHKTKSVSLRIPIGAIHKRRRKMLGGRGVSNSDVARY